MIDERLYTFLISYEKFLCIYISNLLFPPTAGLPLRRPRSGRARVLSTRVARVPPARARRLHPADALRRRRAPRLRRAAR